GYRVEIIYAVHVKQIHIISAEPFKALVQTLRQGFGLVMVQLCGDKQLLPGIGISGKKTPVPLLAQTISIQFSRVPEIYAPVEGLSEDRLIIDRVEHPAKGQNRHFYARFSKPAPGQGAFPGSGWFRTNGATVNIQPG